MPLHNHLSTLVIVLLLLVSVTANNHNYENQYDPSLIQNILDYGAVANTSSNDLDASRKNGKALYDAVQAAHSSKDAKTVLIPSDSTFAFMPYAPMVGLFNVTIVLDGSLTYYEGDMNDWTPSNFSQDPNRQILDGIVIDQSSHITLTSSDGGGVVFGNGNRWWWSNIRHGTPRPNLMTIANSLYVRMEYWHLHDSPRWTANFYDVAHVLIQNCSIQVNIAAQRDMLAQHNLLSSTGLPTVPLNTDGFDIAGKNITIRHCHVENWDDAYCAKPLHQQSNLSTCTTDLLIEDSSITNGVGASIGSVPPHKHVNCIANTTFRRITFSHPIKAIYVKPNPCPHGPAIDGTGIIHNITYEDIYADKPLTWPIYVGTQQQKQPHGGADTGCDFFYPLPRTHCPTYGCVPVTRLQLRNVFMERALWAPGLLRCNETGPCTGWEFTNVTIQSESTFPSRTRNFLCHALQDYKFTNVSVGCQEEEVYKATITDESWTAPMTVN